MALATFKDLCIDAVDAARLARFWAGALHLRQAEDDPEKLVWPTSDHAVWVNRVPEPVTVKQRVHLDVRAESPQVLEELGASVVDRDSFDWVVMRDPEGGELCVFDVTPDAGPGLYAVVVDAADHVRISTWWADVLGARRHESEHGLSYLTDIPGAPFEAMCFVPVPEPKTVKNRIHWDVDTADPALLVDAGAAVLRVPDDEVRWHVLADPEGNEFCAFVPQR